MHTLLCAVKTKKVLLFSFCNTYTHKLTFNIYIRNDILNIISGSNFDCGYIVWQAPYYRTMLYLLVQLRYVIQN